MPAGQFGRARQASFHSLRLASCTEQFVFGWGREKSQMSLSGETVAAPIQDGDVRLFVDRDRLDGARTMHESGARVVQKR
jgi:hypothetical protein